MNDMNDIKTNTNSNSNSSNNNNNNNTNNNNNNNNNNSNSKYNINNNASIFAATVTVIKCAIGVGCFTLPKAFSKGGLWISFLLTLLIGSLSAYTLILLIICETAVYHNNTEQQSTKYEVIVTDDDDKINTVDDNNDTSKTLTYSDLGALIYPEYTFTIFQQNVNLVYLTISLSIIFTSIGVSVAYINFICETIPEVIIDINGEPFSRITSRTMPLILLPIILLLSYLKTFKALSFTAILGDIAVILGCIIIIVYGFMNNYKEKSFDSSILRDVVHFNTIPEFFGSVGFLFAIHVVILPILNELKSGNSNDITDDSKKVVQIAFLLITLFNAFFGLLGYILYNNSYCQVEDNQGPCGNILNNLKGSLLSPVKIFLCIDVLFTIPLVLAASRELIENNFFQFMEKNKTVFDANHTSTARYMIRTLLVFVTFCLSVLFPDFSEVVNLVGGVVCSFTGFIIPPLLYCKVNHNADKIIHRFIILFGMILVILTIIFN